MKLFGWKSAGRAVVRPAKTYVSLARGVGGALFGAWPRSYEAQVREGYLSNAVAQRARCGWWRKVWLLRPFPLLTRKLAR
jgi:hypothetical protein